MYISHTLRHMNTHTHTRTRMQATDCDMARESNGSGAIGLKCAKSACTPLCDKCVKYFGSLPFLFACLLVCFPLVWCGRPS
jgi:hypothetical protein